MRRLFLEAFAEASSDGLLSFDREGRIVGWSRGAERICGFQDADVLGRSAVVLFPEHLRPTMQPLVEAVAAGERVHQIETEFQRRDGMPIPIALTLSPVADPGGRLLGAVAIARELTEVRLAQAALAEVEARLREGEALAHVGRWLWDVGTDAVQWSDELHRIHGVDPLEFAGTFEGYMACIDADDRERVRTAMRAAVASGRQFEQEYTTSGAIGEPRLVYVRAEPMLGSADVVVALRGIGQDVTDRRPTASPRPPGPGPAPPSGA